MHRQLQGIQSGWSEARCLCGSRDPLMVEGMLHALPEALNLLQKVLGTGCGVGGHDHSCALGE